MKSEDEVMSEAVERSFEANLKLLLDNQISHSKRVDTIAEISLANAVDQSNQTNKAALAQADSMNKAGLTYFEALNAQLIENNRFTMDRLYGMFPEEAAGTSTLLKLVIEALKTDPCTLKD